MMLLSRQFSGTVASPAVDSEQYRRVPLLNHRSVLLALMISFMVFSWICSLLRLYTRFVILRLPGWDDFFIIVTMLSTAMGSIILCILPNFGLGRSVYTIPPSEVKQLLKVLYIGNATYPVSATAIKLALLFQYLRVFKTETRYRDFCKCMIVITAAWGIAFITLRWFPCHPVAAYWDFSIKDARCWGFGSREPLSYTRTFVSQATSTAVLDLIVFAIPIRLFFMPNIQRKTRLYLLGLFVLGLLAILCAILRMAFVIKQFTANIYRFDPAWYSATTAGLACLEVHLAAVCAAIPVFWPVLTTTWDRIFVTTEVSVTREYGRFQSKKTRREIELHSTSSHQQLALDLSHESQGPDGWEPFVGDETTGVGENETVVHAPAVVAKRSEKLRETLGLRRP